MALPAGFAGADDALQYEVRTEVFLGERPQELEDEAVLGAAQHASFRALDLQF